MMVVLFTERIREKIVSHHLLYYMKDYYFRLVDWILVLSLSVALVCSLFISIEVYYYKKYDHIKTFSSWQSPMLIALLADIYIMCK
jgi:hypothetical protein